MKNCLFVFEKIKNKLLAGLIKKQKKTNINDIRNEKEDKYRCGTD